MTPHHLDALAAAWSLQRARQALAHLADEEAAQIAAEALEAPALLRSPVWGGRHGSGGHSDPTPGMIAVADRPERRNRWAEMTERLDGKLRGIADMFCSDQDQLALDRILTTLPTLTAGHVYWLNRHLTDEEKWVREAIDQPRPTRPVPGECKACGVRALYVQTAGPEPVWTVVCAGRWTDGRHNPCLCLGTSCPCGMDGAVEGAPHIWPRAAVIGAVAGAAPTTTTN